MSEVRQNNDGTLSVTVKVPPTPEWASLIDTAFRRLNTFCTASNRWHFVSLSVPSYSFGYICVMEKKGITQSMSGSAGLEMAVAGFGSTEEMAIDHAVELAQAYESSK